MEFFGGINPDKTGWIKLEWIKSKQPCRADVKDEDNNVETYTGLTKNSFKKRFYKHNTSMKDRNYEHSTSLSTHIWKLKDRDKNFSIDWSILMKAKPFNPVTGKCNLCIKEKFCIIFRPEGSTLNSRSELFNTCRHRVADLLQSIIVLFFSVLKVF